MDTALALDPRARVVRRSPWLRRAGVPGLAVALLLLAACGGEAPPPVEASASRAVSEPDGSSSGETPREPEAAPVSQEPQSASPAAQRAAAALERGDPQAAARALAELPADARFDRRLLGARLLALQGDAIGAVRDLESLRADYPGQGRVFSTAAELHAAAGRLESSEDEIRRGLAACGPTPALIRARGVLALSRQGAAGIGLSHLLRARAEAPGLWFCDLALSQAQVLLGNAALAEERPLEALGHARAARAAVPDSVDARELEADAAAALGDFETAIAGYESLLAGGEDVSGELALLCQRGATASLLVPDRELAVRRYLRARALGLPEAELGFGAAVLETEAERLLEQGIAAFEGADLPAARRDFEAALECQPDNLEIENHLGVCLFRLGEYDGAAAHWGRVVEAARVGGIELPEPVHVHQARALAAAGRTPEGVAVLRAYLEAEPDGESEGAWTAETRTALAELEP